MTGNEIDMTPVPRDEKALRRTALWLLLFIVVGGVMIFYAYQLKMKKEEKNDRPAVVGDLMKTIRGTLQVIAQDGKRHGLEELKGKVVCLQAISLEDAQNGSFALTAMQETAKRFSNNSNVGLLSIIINPSDPATAKKMLEDIAMKIGANGSQWWIATAEPEVTVKYLKDVCKLEQAPIMENGKLVYDTTIFLVDSELKIRKPVVPQVRGGQAYVATLNFDQAAAWDKKGIKTGTEKSNLTEMQILLEKTITKLLEEKNQGHE